jgi:hypothetical protein
MIMIISFLDIRTRWTKLTLYLGAPLLFLAIHFNNRRLAWVSLAGSLVALYFLLPPSKAKRKLKRVATVVAPVLGLYVAIGWGRTERIFKPVASISSVSGAEDASSKARNVENLGLIRTASYSPRTGTGWGHRYEELSDKYSIAESSELWPYVPHNSILGLFAFTGFLGLMGFWMMFPTAIFMHVRTARFATVPIIRSIGVASTIGIFICLNQYFGDMGTFSRRPTYILAICFAAALRIPVEAGLWPPVRGNGAPAPALPPGPDDSPNPQRGA